MLTMADCESAIVSKRMVTYHAAPGTKGEHGIVTSRSGAYVFVRFAGDDTSKACIPETLSWRAPEFKITGHTYDTGAAGECAFEVLVGGKSWNVIRFWSEDSTEEEWTPNDGVGDVGEMFAEYETSDAWDEVRNEFLAALDEALNARNYHTILNEAIEEALKVMSS